MKRSLSSANFLEPDVVCELAERSAGAVPEGSNTISETTAQKMEMPDAGMSEPP